MEMVQTARRTFSRIGFSLVVMGVIQLLAGLIFGFALGLALATMEIPLNTEGSWGFWLINSAPLYFIAIPLSYLILRKLPAQKPKQCWLQRKDLLLFVLMGFALSTAGNLLGRGMAWLISGGGAQNPLESAITKVTIPTVIFVVIVAPVMEELFFRKLLIDRTIQYGEGCTVLVSALAFALFHANLYQFFYTFFWGALWAYVYVRTGRLRYPVILHMVVNFFGSVMTLLVQSLVDMELLEEFGEMDPTTMQEASQALLEGLPGLMVYLLYSLLILGLTAGGLVVLVMFLTKKRFYLNPGLLQGSCGKQLKTLFLNPGMVIFSLYCLLLMVIALFNKI